LLSIRLATSSDTKPYVESNSMSPRLNTPATRSFFRLGIIPIGDERAFGVSTITESPTTTPRLLARSLPSRNPVELRLGLSAPARRGCRSERPRHVADLGLQPWIDALSEK
jgi:hypothetical protein